MAGDGGKTVNATGGAKPQAGSDAGAATPASLQESIRTNPAVYRQYKARRARAAAQRRDPGDAGESDAAAAVADGAPPAEWRAYLTDLHGYLRDQTGAEKQQLLDLRQLRQDHWVVGGVSEAVAGVKARQRVALPDEGMWDAVSAHLNAAHALLAGEPAQLDAAKREMATAVRLFETAHRRQYEYRSRVEGGADTTASLLRGVEIACDLTVTLLSAGAGGGAVDVMKLGARGVFKLAAEQATKSLAKTAVKAAVAGGANQLAEGVAEQTATAATGLGDFDVGKVIRDAGNEAAMNLLGVLIGGKLSQTFMRGLGRVLAGRMAPNAVAALAAKYGVASGELLPELFVTRGWRFLAGVAGDVCTTTLLTSLSLAVEQVRTGGKSPTAEQFVSLVVEQLIQNGIFQIVFAAVTHERAGGGASEPAGAGQHEAAAGPSHAAAVEPKSADPQAAASQRPSAESPTSEAGAEKMSAKAAEAKAAPRVTEPVPGLMDSIDPLSEPAGWKFDDEFLEPRRSTPNRIELITRVVDPAGRKGSVHRAYDTQTKQFMMLNAFLIEPGEPKEAGVQRRIQHSGTMMDEKSGTPTQLFLTLRQMKLLEQRAGLNLASTTKVKMSTIQNVEAILQLEALRRKGVGVDEAVMQTHSKEYAESTLIQAGKRIVSGKLIGGQQTPINELLTWFEKGMPHRQQDFNELVSKYGINRSDVVLWDYDIEFEVSPFNQGGAR